MIMLIPSSSLVIYSYPIKLFINRAEMTMGMTLDNWNPVELAYGGDEEFIFVYK